MNYTEFLHQEVIKELNHKIDAIFIKALERKGYVFSDSYYLGLCIKKYGKCVDNVDLKERVYYIHDTPFLLHKYADFNVNIDSNVDSKSITMSCKCGSFQFL